MSLQDLKYWIEDLEIRKKLEENQSIVVIGLIALIIVSLGLIVCQMTGGGSGAISTKVKLVYYDLGNQKIRVVDHKYPDIPSSPLTGTTDVYLASVYACEECPPGTLKDGMSLSDLKENGMFIGWLERIDPEATENTVMFGEGYKYRTIEVDQWYSVSDKGFEMINRKVFERCPTARICLP